MKVWPWTMALGEMPVCWDCLLPVSMIDGTCDHPPGCEQAGMTMDEQSMQKLCEHFGWKRTVPQEGVDQ